MRELEMIRSITLSEAREAPVSPDLFADPHHLLDLHVPLSETGLGVIVLVAGDGDVSATVKGNCTFKVNAFTGCLVPMSVSVSTF